MDSLWCLWWRGYVLRMRESGEASGRDGEHHPTLRTRGVNAQRDFTMSDAAAATGSGPD